MLSRKLSNIACPRYAALHDQARGFARIYWLELRLLSSFDRPVAYKKILWSQARSQTDP